ncbi:MAG TPA: acetoacetate--CoA ligase [Gammaproteobacteria bacterium]|nr:acetoacetate--CoA ligase [Gammaproteobacteria bacterium]
MVNEGDLLWTPDAARVEATELTRYRRWLAAQRQLDFPDYESLRAWSVADIEAFWASIVDFFEIRFSAPYTRVLARREMPGAEWFPGARLNFAEHMLRRARAGETAFHYAGEGVPLTRITWDDLLEQVTRLAARLRALGVGPGDRVVSFMPNIPQTAIAFLAAASLGAVWSSCSTDFGVRSVLDRFQQIEPKVLFCVDGYRYGGRHFDRRAEAAQIVAALPSLAHVIYLRHVDTAAPPPVPQALEWRDLLAAPAPGPLVYEQLPFDHPLWVVYSSGTTGLPKALVHGHGGITLELHKSLALHCNLRPGSTMFFYTTSGWIMWNVLVGALIVGAAAVIYDGNPASPEIDVLWRLASETRATLFGASPTYVGMMQKNGVVPREKHAYDALEGVLLSGSPVTPESMQWLYDEVKSDLWVTSQSGGTDICAGFVVGAATEPVYAGEIQVRGLGVDVQAYDEAGRSVVGEVGELVCCQPMPSMPLYFWNDPDMRRYRDSYFAEYPGKWRHGDFLKINARGGCYIQGRSDSTLNRYGVRIGTAEIYRSVETLAEIEDSLVVNLDLPGGRFFMPMFVKTRPGVALDAALIARIDATLREQCSPRHVPDRIYAVDAVPYTLTGKKLEVPVRKILMGVDVAQAASRDAMMNPAALDYFIEFAREQRDYRIAG